MNQRIAELLYPELRAVPAWRRAQVLRRAYDTPFDAFELLGMAFALVAVTALTSYGVSGIAMGARVLTGIANFLLSLPLLAIALAPFWLRRTRRGLRAEINKSQSTTDG
jgi:hypothetical protein